jgi:amino acid adenylation domain-containing protein
MNHLDGFVPIHRTIADRAAETPDAPAVTDESAGLTYAELIANADALAAALIRDGLRPGDAVAVHMQRSCALVVALLAVSRAGGGSLMLDVDGPRQWLSRFVEVAKPVAWITHDDSADPQFGKTVFRLDASGRNTGGEAGTTEAGSADVEFPEVGPEDLACMVQTSGSTGVPKLVLVPHRTWTYASQTQQSEHSITRDERGAWLFPAHTNVSVSVVIWPFLAAGAHLSIPSPEVVSTPEDLAVWVREQEITQFFAVAPLAEALAKLDWPPSPLRIMLTGSDRVREWGKPDLPFEIGNWYGANEVNIVTSSVIPWDKRITSATASVVDRSSPPPIGRAWPGVGYRVVGPDGEPVPPGEVGELLVGGRQIAIGYLSPRQTAERFTPDEDGTRIYHTGDLVRVRANGVFEHCGRVDEQMKINGMRVEMAEVELAMLACPGVKEAAAAPVETPSGRAQLVGYVVTEREISDVELRRRLIETLPPHMVPVAFVRMERLPRNRGDKIDRRALPSPYVSAFADEHLEDTVTCILAKVLNQAAYSPDDNFFLLGGDSMLATKAARELSRELKRPLSIEDFMLHPTGRELTAFLKENR